MQGEAINLRGHAGEAQPGAAPIGRTIARGSGWAVSEFICGLGPQDRPFEERHDLVAISAVVEGSFQYRSPKGRALLYPGSFLLGDADACFECGHEHGRGDRCIAFRYEPAFFEEIAASIARSHRYRFPAPMLPAIRALAGLTVDVEAATRGGGRMAMVELAIHVAETVLAATSGVPERAAAPAPRDQRRVTEVLRHVEAHAAQPFDLTALAAMAAMSKYHFLRTFRRVTGVTPHQFLLGLRMRRAAVRLRTTPLPVATIAYDEGFGDLSTFNDHFRTVFGERPSRFRRNSSRGSV